jgi:hypothetical protein
MQNYIPFTKAAPENEDIINESTESIMFEGDFFHTGPDDLEWPEDNTCDPVIQADSSDSEEDAEEEAEADGGVAEQERDWEPPINEQPVNGDVPMSEEDLASATGNDEGNLNRTHHHAVELPLHEGRHIVKFPLHSAGAIMRGSDSSLGQPHGFQAYRNQLDSTSSMWAPFTSHIDYEVARWAKLRGKGSTAFSELLEIKGVSNLITLHTLGGTLTHH